MSTQEIGALIDSVNQLTGTVAGKMGQIDQKMVELEKTAKNAVFSEMTKTIYVDQLNGSDSNQGTSSDPLKSIATAISKVPNGGQVNIVCKSDITDIYGANSRTEYEEVFYIISGNKKVDIDLNNFTFYAKTHIRKEGETESLAIQQKFYCTYGSNFMMRRGRLDVDYTNPDHAAKPAYYHPNYRGFIRVENNYVKLEQMDVNYKVPTMALYSLDGWSGTRAETILNYCDLQGQGVLRYASNGVATTDDIHVAKRASTIAAEWTNQ
ncbi:TPA: hypothetical protein JG810_004518 [Vibrio parahaemolyticus]|nr:hypothetical protein [Vibrio parahaemolyticus]